MITSPSITPHLTSASSDFGERKQSRRVVHRTHGITHGPITRLMSPMDLGRRVKPFVFLDLMSFPNGTKPQTFPMHPHSGIATLTYLFEGEGAYADTTGQQGKTGILRAGGVEWMLSGKGVWHTGGAVDNKGVLGFQLWVALPPDLENAEAHSICLDPEQVEQEGPASVILGSYGMTRSVIEAPSSMSYLAVRLKDGERWTFEPPKGHTVAWLAVAIGCLDSPTSVDAGEMVVFDESSANIEFLARGDTAFVLGSAQKHPHELVCGSYSVHTSREALQQGEDEIKRLAHKLKGQGLLG